MNAEDPSPLLPAVIEHDGCSLAVPEPSAPPAVLTVHQLPLTGLYGALLSDAKKPATAEARAKDVRDFGRYLKVGDELACAALVAQGRGAAAQLLDGYQQHMLGRGLAASSVNRRMSTLMRVLAIARKYELITWTVDVEALPCQSYRDTRGPGRATWMRFEAQAKREGATSDEGRRNWGIVQLCYGVGLRRSTVSELDLEHWDSEGARLSILGKGRHQRKWIAVNVDVAQALERWLDVRGRESGPLFHRLDHRAKRDGSGAPLRLGDNGIWEVCRSISQRAGLKTPVRPHGIRHWAATTVAERSGGNVLMVQQFLDHSDPKTSQIYIDNLNTLQEKATNLLAGD